MPNSKAHSMKLVILVHPPALSSTSMPRFAHMIGDGMAQRGHDVEYWTSPLVVGRFPVSSAGGRKWLSYVDQFLIFPALLAKRIRRESFKTLFVVTDHGLGPWVPRIVHRPHVIHCHDFLAQRSAIGEVPENPTTWTGKRYQELIRRGYRRGRHFISVSQRTKADLHRLLLNQPATSEVVYNGLNADFRVLPVNENRRCLHEHFTSAEVEGFLLHVGGNKWYKNRSGVIELYRAWCERTDSPIPLWMIGGEPGPELRRMAENMPRGSQVRFLVGLRDEQVRAAYNLAKLFLFPSLEEGFGWPIVEAMACGTPVLTTDAAPMTEVGESAAVYHRRRQSSDATWASDGAAIIESICRWTDAERQARVQDGLRRASELSMEQAIDGYEKVYADVLARSSQSNSPPSSSSTL